MTSTPGPRRDAKVPEHATPVQAIYLVGFMGAGKTSVGRELSRQLGWQFEDLDDRIRAREGRTIPDIFAQSGEAHFRRSELAALRELLAEVESGARMVAALGGGAFAQAEVTALLQEAGALTVFLDAPVDELWRRCGDDAVERPLRREEGEFRRLYEARRPRYLQARMRVETAGREIAEIVHEIAGSLKLQDRRSGEEK